MWERKREGVCVEDLCVRLHLDDRSKEHFYLEAEEIPGVLNDKAFQDHQEWVLYKMVLVSSQHPLRHCQGQTIQA